ncbi:Arabinose operon regulatory protein [Nocardia otitidiscaviarum]|uniref:Arabinose operon regulatory protein n=1 Tax=Nocardia otitidiscaviarum TaxID=1823 RepID=A0A378YA23_9NOCA|nr:helix-turn-helix domain-containing protein [Nocardia otitidiscaviarum]SUA73400.1 Arabinose operon regulatory protein [Nocardia otitidiscaviarum]
MITHLVLDGVLEGALGLGIDVVDTAAGFADDLRLRQRVVSVDGDPVRSGTGRDIAVTNRIPLVGNEFGPGDVLVLPGPSAASASRVRALLARPDTLRAIDLIRDAAANGATVAASCSATFVLAAAGLLAGREATTTWWLAPLFTRMHPDITVRADRMVVDGGSVLTAGAAFAHADLVLALLARLSGPDLAHRVARYLVLDARMSQSRYMVLEHLRASDPTLRAVEQHVTTHLHRQLTLTELASAAAVSPRTLTRRTHEHLGITPTEFVHRLRVGHAATLLTTTRDPIDAVAAAVGYADPAAFRRIYRRHTGETPTTTRSRANHQASERISSPVVDGASVIDRTPRSITGRSRRR